MDLRQLKYLVTLAKERHFARAADRCFVTQPTLSARIRQLEDEFGVPLVIRDHRFRGLTRFGERVVNWANVVLEDCDALKQDFSRIRQAGEGVISVGIVPSASPLACLLLSFLRQHDIPVSVDIQTLSAQEVTRRVSQGNLNLGITYESAIGDDDFRTFPLVPESYVALKFGEHGTSSTSGMSWSDLSANELCLPTMDVPGRSMIDRCLEENCKDFDVTLETDCWLTMMQSVRRNGLVGIAPSHVVGILAIPPGTSVRPLPIPETPLELTLIADPNHPEEPALENVIKVLEEFHDFFESESTAFEMASA
ncbi:MAG: LysR family transcriptional regulator [Erythrobacter sp.]